MGTIAKISVMHGDKVKSVHVHLDGYLQGAGKILYEHYDSVKANELVSLGNIYTLGREIGTKHEFKDTSEAECTFFGRDRDGGLGKWSVTDINGIFNIDMPINHYYLMRAGVWYYTTNSEAEFRPLGEVLTMHYLQKSV